MTTSANVTCYTVKDAEGNVVFEGSQHAYCKNTIKETLKALPNPESLTIEAVWPDEDECDQCSRPMPLDRYLKGERLVWPSTMGEELYDENQALLKKLDELFKLHDAHEEWSKNATETTKQTSSLFIPPTMDAIVQAIGRMKDGKG